MFRIIELTVFAVITLAVGAAIFIMFPEMKTEAAASWVQAVGSILAIIGAVWVSNIQHEQSIDREERQRIARRKDVLQAIHSVLKQARELVDAMPNDENTISQISGYLEIDATLQMFEEVEQVLRLAPLYEACNYNVVAIVLGMSSVVDKAKSLFIRLAEIDLHNESEELENILGAIEEEKWQASRMMARWNITVQETRISHLTKPGLPPN